MIQNYPVKIIQSFNFKPFSYTPLVLKL